MAATVALAAVSALGGCSSGGAKNGASPAPGTSTGTGTPSATATDAGTPSPGQSAGQSQSPGSGTTGGTGTQPVPGTSSSAPAPSASPSASEATLVVVTRSGGMTGKASTLIIREDGSFLRLDAKAATVDRDKLPAAGLAKLRTALEEADFPRLPRISKPDRPVIDAFTYAFRYAGYEVAADQTTMPQPLQKVMAALPPFEPR